ncbi:hypothetical protein CLN94_13670 [Pseudothioclava arenosa]|uniref:Uncharacterized protein n=1 Tax=Pseudothioclava arenosa TaxID=1795308 RepID=A0A2A4CM14_9RHOB|nr:hypothetical protein CLN94_13670 [Pseudothioclava arenosa]
MRPEKGQKATEEIEALVQQRVLHSSEARLAQPCMASRSVLNMFDGRCHEPAGLEAPHEFIALAGFP